MLMVNNLYSDAKKRIILSVCHIKTQDSFINNYPQRVGLISVVSGIAKIVFEDGTETPIKAGDVFVYGPNCKYKVECASLVELYTAHFRVSDFIVGDNFQIYSKESTSMLTGLFDELRSTIDAQSDFAKKIQDNIVFINEILDNRSEYRSVYSEITVRSAFVFIMSLILQYFLEDAKYKLEGKVLHNKDVEKSVTYITEHLGDELTLDELAKIAMMGKTNYSVAFKRIMGMTVWDYILNARVELATSYLLEKNKELTIAEIGLRCGFNNSTHFNKVFKKVKGKTPSEFKKEPDNPCFL